MQQQQWRIPRPLTHYVLSDFSCKSIHLVLLLLLPRWLPAALESKCAARHAAFAQGLETTGPNGRADTHAWVPCPFSRSTNLNGRHRILHQRTKCAALSAAFAQGNESAGPNGRAKTHAWVPCTFSRSTNGREYVYGSIQNRMLHFKTLCAALSAAFAQGLEKTGPNGGVKTNAWVLVLVPRPFSRSTNLPANSQ